METIFVIIMAVLILGVAVFGWWQSRVSDDDCRDNSEDNLTTNIKNK